MVVARLVELAEQRGEPRFRGTRELLRTWEDLGAKPRERALRLLCVLYEASPADLGLASSAPIPAPPPQELQPPDPVHEHAERTRRAINRTLAASTVSPGGLDLLDERLDDVRRLYVTAAPEQMIHHLLADLDDIQVLAAERQPAAAQARLSELTAIVSTLVADAWMKLGRLPGAQRWYGTARLAADDAGNSELRARVRVQAAMLPYYYGPLLAAANLAREARLLSRGRPGPTAVFAVAAEARSLARLGDRDGAQAAIRMAKDFFEHCQADQDQDDAWAFPERRLWLYLSGAHTALGETSQARQAQQQALALYPEGHTGIDPALLRLEEAMCLVIDHSPTEALQLTVHTYDRVPGPHRTAILGARARDVIAILPTPLRSGRPARQIAEMFALPAGQE
ncbi:XRE family transcriptional regulator [Kitasatospora sp. NPDC048298]|uniref:XRE family transcriptional regulator n=1 Tax=Kitasatospora sp. NPDC048298 TaxID=3364049 RepID=UPI00371915CE